MEATTSTLMSFSGGDERPSKEQRSDAELNTRNTLEILLKHYLESVWSDTVFDRFSGCENW